MNVSDELFFSWMKQTMRVPSIPYIKPIVYLTDVEPRETLDGYDVKNLRGFLRGFFGLSDANSIPEKEEIRPYELAVSIPRPDYIHDAETALKVCEKYGFCTVNWSAYPRLPFSLTDKGNLFINSSEGKISRKTVLKNLLVLIDQAQTYNQNPDALKRITRITIFGSFLTSDLEKCGDLDLIFTWDVIDSAKYREAEVAHQAEWKVANPHRDEFRDYNFERYEIKKFMPRRPNFFNFSSETTCILDFDKIPYLTVFEDRPRKMFNSWG